MAHGQKIIVQSPPKGVFEECIISGTPSPGIVMEIVPGVAPVGGRFTYRAATSATGLKKMTPVLTEDSLQGKTTTDAYVSGTRGFIYWPTLGEDLNMLVQVPGTGTGAGAGTTVGLLMAVGSNGLLLAGTGTQVTPFMCQEALSDVTAGSELTWVKFIGSAA